MTAPKFKAQLKQLGWSFSEAARELGVPSGRPRIHEWATGKRKIPPYIAAHMKTLGLYGALKAEVMARFEREQKKRTSEEAR
jgi:hypothetical protein